MTRSTDRVAIVQQHFAAVQNEYPNLELLQDFFGNWIVRGPLQALAIRGEVEVTVEGFEIEISIPGDYPSQPPWVRETEGRTSEFHTYSDGTLCLGAPLAVKATYRKDPTLLGFIEKSIIPYFFSYIHWKKSGKLPYGELSHGAKGIVEFYRELFVVETDQQILPLLRVLADNDYRGHVLCPCNSGLIMRTCHGATLLDIKSLQSPLEFMKEYCQVALEAFSVKDVVPEIGRSKVILKKFPHLVRKNFLLGCYKELDL